ncbi:hypothetical protein QQP08_014841, partial [Theobroma cacao]
TFGALGKVSTATKLSHHLIFTACFLFLVVQAVMVKPEIQFSNCFQNLQGAQKGYKVKQYFKAFGYYPNYINLTDDYDNLYGVADILNKSNFAYGKLNMELTISFSMGCLNGASVNSPTLSVPMQQ